MKKQFKYRLRRVIFAYIPFILFWDAMFIMALNEVNLFSLVNIFYKYLGFFVGCIVFILFYILINVLTIRSSKSRYNKKSIPNINSKSCNF